MKFKKTNLEKLLDLQKRKGRDETAGNRDNVFKFSETNKDYIVRIIPQQTIDMPIIQCKRHVSLGNVSFIPCLSFWNEECPICFRAWKLYNKASDMNNETLLAKFKNYLPKQSFYAQVYDCESNSLKIWIFSWKVFTSIMNILEQKDKDGNPIFGDIFDIKEGSYLHIKKVKEKGNAYPHITVYAEPKKSDITSTLKDIPDESYVDLTSYITRPNDEYIEEAVDYLKEVYDNVFGKGKEIEHQENKEQNGNIDEESAGEDEEWNQEEGGTDVDEFIEELNKGSV